MPHCQNLPSLPPRLPYAWRIRTLTDQVFSNLMCVECVGSGVSERAEGVTLGWQLLFITQCLNILDPLHPSLMHEFYCI